MCISSSIGLLIYWLLNVLNCLRYLMRYTRSSYDLRTSNVCSTLLLVNWNGVSSCWNSLEFLNNLMLNFNILGFLNFNFLVFIFSNSLLLWNIVNSRFLHWDFFNYYVVDCIWNIFSSLNWSFLVDIVSNCFLEWDLFSNSSLNRYFFHIFRFS